MGGNYCLIFILLMITPWHFVNGQIGFEDPKSEGVVFGASSDSNQPIELEENRATVIAIITGATGDLSIVNPSPSNAGSLLGITFVQDGGNYKLNVTNPLDYEAPDTTARTLFFQVQSGDTTSSIPIKLTIKNIDDTPPTFTPSNECSMKENDANGFCNFQLEDPDGWLNKMDFRNVIQNTDKNEDTIFEFKFDPAITDDITTKGNLKIVLKEGKKLDYEETTLYIFNVKIQDPAGHGTTPENIQVIVVVEDVPDKPPVFTDFKYTFRINEEEEHIETISARDGDYGINAEINYRIDDPNGYATIEDPIKGEIKIKPVDRDGGIEQISFNVTAYEVGDIVADVAVELKETTELMTILIDDIDDNAPLIILNDNQKLLSLQIDEGANSISDLIYIYDYDTGANAMYTTALKEVQDNIAYTSAFDIVPTNGYENSTFTLLITNSMQLDFENDDWKVIQFQIYSEGTKNSSMNDYCDVTISLNDINDEIPIFEDNGNFFAEVKENVGIGEVITTVQATDKDAEDSVLKHEILGTSSQYFAIPPEGGKLTTKVENVFDYESQTEVIVQIKATDAAKPVPHTANAQVTITVIDVDDVDPVMKVTTSNINIDENRPDGFEIECDITAEDRDTMADVKFHIDWSQSYATKNSAPVANFQENCDECIIVETESVDGTKNVKAKLTVKETVKDNTPDFELYDKIVIWLVANDTETEEGLGYAQTPVTITINNLNDNKPEFTEETKQSTKSVTENAAIDSVIAVLTATDLDDPSQKNITYSLTPNEGTPDNWVRFEAPDSGVLRVNFDQIDCDDPPRDKLEYTVIASDGELQSDPLNININIIDINDNSPTFGGDCSKTISEDNEQEPDKTQDGELIFALTLDDKDRDEVNKKTACDFEDASKSVTERFGVDDNNNVNVALQGGATLDREEFPDGFTFRLKCANTGDITKSTTFSCNIKLADVNDKIPFIDAANITTDEHITTDVELSPPLTAHDDDEDKNGQINYKVVSIDWFIDENYQTPSSKEPPQDMFDLVVDETTTKSITIKPTIDLKGYYGFFKMTIQTTDRGDKPLSQENSVNIIVQKYMFESPTILFPVDSTAYYLRTSQNAGKALRLYNGDEFPNFVATDTKTNNDSTKFSISFDCTLCSSDNLFTLVSKGNSMSQLQIRQDNNNLPSGIKNILILTAKIEDHLPSEIPDSSSVNITIQFFDSDSQPVYDLPDRNIEKDFNENQTDISQPTASATYGDIADDIAEIFYILQPKMTCPEDVFTVNSHTGDLTLVKALNYDEMKECDLTIQASNTQNGIAQPREESLLNVKINVKDVNNHIPSFDRAPFFGTILTNGDRIGTNVLDASAVDPDTTGSIKYSIVEGSLSASDSSIKGIKEPFKIDDNGNIILSFTLQETMRGYFTFKINAVDEDPTHVATADVTIYVVTEANTVNFKFENTIEDVAGKYDKIKQILDKQFDPYKSNIESSSKDKNNDDVTVTPVYFIDDNKHIPINTSEIIGMVTNLTVFTNLRRQFSNETQLTLLSFVTETPDEDLEEILKAWLIGTAVVLGVLVIVLIVAFLLRTRSLNRRIKDLLKPKFGSQESGLNRQGVAVPTTNKHAVEGSNPVFNNEIDTKELDRKSITSGDSDLIGVEDNAEFDYEIKEPF